jgi:hypothetical protein
MRRMVLFVTVALVVASAMIAAGALPTFAEQAKTRSEGRVGWCRHLFRTRS